MNNNGYLIDNEVIFLPSEKTIKSKKSNQTQTLHAPAARCLQLLIERKTTVPQASLYKAGWGEDALKKVSTATYYQCFVNLRKQLREIDYSGELLITVPKEGMKINDAIEITTFTPLPEKRAVTKIEKHTSVFKGMRVNRLLITVLILVCSGCLLFFSMFISSDREEYFRTLGGESYQRYQELPECIYVRSVQHSGVDVPRINQLIHANNLSCKAMEKIFIHQGKVRTTVFRCPENMACNSITYMNKPS